MHSATKPPELSTIAIVALRPNMMASIDPVWEVGYDKGYCAPIKVARIGQFASSITV